MSIKNRVLKLTAVLTAFALLTLSAGFAWAVADDYTTREIVPAGVTVDGHEIGGLSREAARTYIEANVAGPLLEPITVTYGDRSFEFDPRGALEMDIDAMLDEAFGPKVGVTVAERTYRQLADVQVPLDIAPRLSVEGGPLESWLADVASQIDTPSVEATVTITDGALVVVRSATGLQTDRDSALEAITQALLDGTKSVGLPVDMIEPAFAEEDLGTWLHVDLSERKVYLYNALDVVKTYGIAVGAPGYSTPRGEWEITLKRYMPTWRNPGSAWAADMPASIPPGPGNPLGTRAINIDAPGIRFHGTSQDWSIGRAASHGCMRMHRWDVEDLYERVEVGNKVYIVR